MFPNYFQIVAKTIIDLFLNTRVIFVTIHYIHTRIDVHVVCVHCQGELNKHCTLDAFIVSVMVKLF